MQILTTTNARKQIKQVVDSVKHHGAVFGIGRRNSIDALIIGFPTAYNSELSDITNVNAYSHAFDFLAEEPDLYTVGDVKKRYA